MVSARLIIININENYVANKIEKKNYDKMKYQLFSVPFSEEAHWLGKVCVGTLLTTLKHKLSKAKCSTRFEPCFQVLSVL